MTAPSIGYARGAFDLFHIGHLNLLTLARSECDRLIAGVVTDGVLLRTKGIGPVIPLHERLEIVGSLRCVDVAVADEWEDAAVAAQQLGFTVFFKGDDWRGTPRGLALEESLAEVGVRVQYFPYTATTSSTRVRRALEARA